MPRPKGSKNKKTAATIKGMFPPTSVMHLKNVSVNETTFALHFEIQSTVNISCKVPFSLIEINTPNTTKKSAYNK